VNAGSTTMCTSDDVALAVSGSQSIRGVPRVLPWGVRRAE
jgi:hypothetical protein